MLASCAPEQETLTLQTSVVRSPPRPVASALPRAAPRPARKPIPPSPAESPAPATGEEALAMNAPKPSVEQPAPEASSPSPDPAPIATSHGPAGSVPPQPGELIGLDQAAATRMFGPSTERWEKPPATVWRYKNANCELDLFFYLDLRSGRMRALHYAFKGDGADNTARRQECLKSLLAARDN